MCKKIMTTFESIYVVAATFYYYTVYIYVFVVCFWVGGVGSELWQRMQGRGMERKDNSMNKIVAKSLLTVQMGSR